MLTYFAAYTGLRTEEIAGIEIGDVQFLPTPVVKVARAKKRQGGRWVPAPLKSANSRRSVDLPGWLAVRLGDYLASHPRRDEATAPLWPNRVLGGSRSKGQLTAVPLDFSEPVEPTGFYKNVLKPALRANGLPASTPAVFIQVWVDSVQPLSL